MKRLLRNSLLAIATLAMASTATVNAKNFYILGEANGNSWAPNVGVLMDADEDEPDLYFSATVKFNGENDGYSYFSFTEKLGANAGDWSGIASSRYGASSNNFDLTPVLAEDYEGDDPVLIKGENAFKVPAGTYTIDVDLDEMTMSIYAEEEEDPNAVHVYIIGTVDEMSWSPAEGTEMYNDEGDNVLYEAEGVVVGDSGDGFGYFGFTTMLAESDSDWDAIAPYRFGGVGEGDVLIAESDLGNELPLTKAGYQAFKLAAGTYDLTVNYSTMKLTVVKGSEEPVDPETSVFVMGNINGNDWGSNVGVEMEEDAEAGEEEEAFVLECAVSDGDGEGNGYFSFTTQLSENADDWDAIAPYRFGAVSEGDFVLSDDLLGQEISLTYENGQAIKAPVADDYTIKVNLTTMKAVITRGATPEPTIDLYVLGDVNGKHFAANDGVKMTAQEGEGAIYTLTADLTNSSADDGFSYFSFSTALAENADDWDAIADARIGAVSEGDFWLSDEYLGTPLALTGENGQAYRAPQGNYSMTVDLDEMTLTITRNSLVPAPAAPTFSPAAGEYEESVAVTIAAEEGAVIRYTLDGSEPNRESAQYAEPIVINEVGTTTVKAIAIKNGIASEVAEAAYTITQGGGGESGEAKLEVILESKSDVIASGDGRFSTGFGNYIYINDKANGKVVRFDKTGARSDFAAVEGVGTAITSDDAGNILVNKGFPGATSSVNWVIIEPDGTQHALAVEFPAAVTAARLDQAGRVVGDVMSEDGGYFFLTANGADKVVCVKVANGEFVEAIESPTAQYAFDTSSIAQPRYSFEETEAAADISTAVVYRKRGVLNVYGWTEDGSEVVDFGRIEGARSCEGFDIFTINDIAYTVEPSTSTNYASGFAIRELGKSETIISRGDDLYAGGSQRFQSFTARVADGTAIIYRHVSGEGVSMYKFTPAGTGVESVAAEGEVVSTTYYNLQGVRVNNPAAGQILIKVNTLSNGKISASKVLVR